MNYVVLQIIVVIIITVFINNIQTCFNYQHNWNPLINNCNKPHIAAVILARGGSKGIPLKNLSKINNQTLIINTLNKINRIKNEFSSIWVSTDHDLIIKEALKFKSVNIHLRTIETATDEASSLLAVQEFLKTHAEIEVIVLIQCTSPFLQTKYLLNGLRLILNNSYKIDCIFSVTRSFKLRWKEINNKKLKPVNFNPKLRPRRQDWNGELVENGMFYIAKRKLIINDNTFQNDK